MSLTQGMARFVADVAFERLPAPAVDVARTGFIDCIATMIAGAGEPAPQVFDRQKSFEVLSARQLTAIY